MHRSAACLVLAFAACSSPEPPPLVQTTHGERPPAELVASFDGLGFGFTGPQGSSTQRNPSDNSLAVGPDHIVQTVNTRTAIFTKKGARYDSTGVVLYGPVANSNFFRGFGGPCEAINNGDTVVRYDQLAGRWLVVMPIFRRLERRANEPPKPTPADGPVLSTPGRADQPGPAEPLFLPPAPTPEEIAAEEAARLARRQRAGAQAPQPDGSFAMCYAISATDDPMDAWYRYEFVRPLFPDYPRPAVWPDGYYVPTSTGDDVIEKHACVVEREAMLRGEPAREVCLILADVSFLNNADLDGFQLPPSGAPNPMLAAGGSQLNGITADSVLYAWNYNVDWADPSRTRLEGPARIPVAPYRFLCDGQLTNCVPQPGSEQRLDSQGDKIMARLVYRRIGEIESIVAAMSVAVDPAWYTARRGERPTGSLAPDSAGLGGGVRWYDLHVRADRSLWLHQQGTYAPGGDYRWMASPAIDAAGGIGIGYSFGGTKDFAGQRFAGRTATDPLGVLTLSETILVEGEAAQEGTLRWEDYTQTAVDPSDDCTIWYVGDYLKEGADTYSTRIGAFRLPGCPAK